MDGDYNDDHAFPFVHPCIGTLASFSLFALFASISCTGSSTCTFRMWWRTTWFFLNLRKEDKNDDDEGMEERE